MENNILVDSGFWFALYDINDQYHCQATKIVEYFDSAEIIIPFPTLYETINTKFMKNKMAKIEFEAVLNQENVFVVSDEKLKDEALKITFGNDSTKRSLSLVDNIIRLILENSDYRVNCLITFNKKDFVDICEQRQIKIEPNN
jgi:predicted nucleic acid-binding protein